MARSKEPVFWSLFAAGGAISAFALPVMIFLTGIAAWLHWPEGGLAYEKVSPLLHNLLVRLILFGVIFFTLFHCAHRLKFTVPSLFGMHGGRGAFGALFYLIAAGGSGFAAWVLLKL